MPEVSTLSAEVAQAASDLDLLPDYMQSELQQLRASLDAKLPKKLLDDNLLIATWNLKSFGDLANTVDWNAREGESPKRDLRSVLEIAEIVSRFDVIAIQEVTENIKALRYLMRSLGDSWAFTLTDVTAGEAGNNERIAFVFDTRRVRPSGLASELVLPPEWKGTKIDPDLGRNQFARTPYAVSFLAEGREYRQTFILVALHVKYGKVPEDRTGELAAIAEWLSEWAHELAEYGDREGFGQNLIPLGDFNIDRKDDPNYRALTSTGLQPPKELEKVPRTIFSNSKDNYYDQIAWFTGEKHVPALALKYSGKAGYYDFTGMRPDLDAQQLQYKISDHYPLWCEFLLHE